MKSQHTPGPWGIGELIDTDSTRHVVIQHTRETQGAVCLISSVKLFNETHAANALLIAAAPDLLAACEFIEFVHREQCGDCLLDAIQALRNAIAKAKGESL